MVNIAGISVGVLIAKYNMVNQNSRIYACTNCALGVVGLAVDGLGIVIFSERNV